MIKVTQGNLLSANAEALVNTVNCVGYMGKGIALQFKQAFPENCREYQKACDKNKVKPGNMLVFETGSMLNPRYIINFPTKRHWKGNSRIEDIRAGLKALVTEIRRLKIKSVAIPPLGCGLGGLNWTIVRTVIVESLSALPEEVEVLVYEPKGSPEAKTMPVRTKHPKMTTARALLVKLMGAYKRLDYTLTLLEIQKLAYFLQEAGEPLRLKYEQGHYGPYAANLNKVLELLEGHFTRGYGDSQKPDVEIEILPGATEAADGFLGRNGGKDKLLERVSSLIEGFETPYGMELLASVHWVAAQDKANVADEQTVIERIHQWSDRKRRLFKANHIRIAWARLKEQGWID
jgi:O-acetyl-ADP-ribose deacetylase (regulator of RNase III)